jgi:hypothetical protein
MTNAHVALTILLCLTMGCSSSDARPKTTVSIHGADFFINNEITLKGRSVDGVSLEGLLPNARMVQGIFDDLNSETRHLWKHPDTGEWIRDRNTYEFIAAMPAQQPVPEPPPDAGKTLSAWVYPGTDGNPETYWAIDDNVKTATFEVDMEGPVDVNTWFNSGSPC